MRPTFLLINNNIPFLFVVPPMDLRVESEQDINIIKIIDLGEKSIIGNRRVKKISFSTFLPNFNSKFFSILNPTLPGEAIQILNKWKDEKAEVSLVIPEFNMFYKCYITRLEFSVIERTGDINISLSLTERGNTKSLIDEVRNLYVR